MNINTLQYALTLAEEGNMRNAARRLYISQPSLSQSIRRLELELGTSLFIREKGGIKPTQAGCLYLEWAKKVVHSQKNMLDKINAVKGGRASSIKIGTTFYRASRLLAQVLPRFLERCPGCRVIVEECSSSKLESLLENKSIDFSITPASYDQIKYVNVPFFQERILLAAPFSLPLSCRESEPYASVSVQALHGVPFVILAEDLYIGRLARSFFSQPDCEPNIIMQCRTLDTALSMVHKGLAATLVPLPLYSSDAPECIRYYQINHPAAVREISVIYRKEHYLTWEEKQLLDLLMEDGSHKNPVEP